MWGAAHHVFRYADPSRGTPQPLAAWWPTEAAEAAVKRGPYQLSVALDGPVAPGRHPLAVLSHGSGGTAFGHHDLAAGLARRGWVVVAPTHAGNSFLDDSATGSHRMWGDRPGQASAALDFALEHQRLGLQIDATRVAAIGFSAGGSTVLMLGGALGEPDRVARHCAEVTEDAQFAQVVRGGHSQAGPAVDGYDPRVRAVVAMAPVGALFSDAALAGVTVPVLIWGAGRDALVAPAFHARRVAEILGRRAEYREEAEAGHFSFMAPLPAQDESQFGPAALDPPGFDRAAFLARLIPAVGDFLDGRC